MDTESSFASYRKALSAAGNPCMPYLGTHLSDLTFIEDGNPNEIDGYINFKKRDMLSGVLLIIFQAQQGQYKNEILEPIYTLLEELPHVEDKDLWEISTYLEPKDKKEISKKDKKDKKDKHKS